MVTILLTSIAGLVMLLLAAFLGAFYALAKHPPVIHVDIGDVRIDMVGTLDMTQAIPSPLHVRFQPLPVLPDTPAQYDEPFPLNVLAYIDEESDDWARTARRKRARSLRVELGNWDAVLAMLKKEDGNE